MSEDKKKTEIERHYIGGGGTIFEFLTSSESVGKWIWDQNNLVDCLKKVAKVDKKEDREFMLSLIETISNLDKSGIESRKRFTTLKTALEKINKALQESQDA